MSTCLSRRDYVWLVFGTRDILGLMDPLSKLHGELVGVLLDEDWKADESKRAQKDPYGAKHYHQLKAARHRRMADFHKAQLELAIHHPKLAKKHGVDPDLVHHYATEVSTHNAISDVHNEMARKISAA